jgi:hypothetical protein
VQCCGVAGQLAFFRRLARHGGPGSLPLPGPPAANGQAAHPFSGGTKGVDAVKLSAATRITVTGP